MKYVEALRLLLQSEKHGACAISDFAKTNLNFSDPQTLVAINKPVREFGNKTLLDFLLERIEAEKNDYEQNIFRDMQWWLKSNGAQTLTQLITAHPAAARLYQLTQPKLETLNPETRALFEEIKNAVAEVERTNSNELPHIAQNTTQAIRIYNHLKTLRNLLAQAPNHRQRALLPWLTFTLQDYLPTLSIFENLGQSLQQVPPHQQPPLNHRWSVVKYTPEEAPSYQTIQAQTQQSPLMQAFLNRRERVEPQHALG